MDVRKKIRENLHNMLDGNSKRKTPEELDNWLYGSDSETEDLF